MSESDLIARMALEWIRADRLHRSPDKQTVTVSAHADELAIATDRVYAILAGDIRWSEASPADRAIWRGRLRDVERFDAWWRTRLHDELVTEQPDLRPTLEPDPYNQQAPMPKARPNSPQRPQVRKQHRRRQYTNVYDTVRVDSGGFASSGADTTLFNNANVGNLWMSNLVVAGGVSDDCSFYIETMYVRADRIAGLVATAHLMRARFRSGDQLGMAIPVSELVMGIPIRQAIPQRGTFAVLLDGDIHNSQWQEVRERYHLTVYLEGVRIWP